MEKYKVESGTVQETLMMPLYGRVYCEEHSPKTFPNKAARRTAEKVDYDFGKVQSSELNMIVWGLRARLLQEAAKDYLKTNPKATIINLGGGICFDGENQKGVDKSNKIVQKTGNGTKIYFPTEDSRAMFASWGDCFKKVIERPFPNYVKKSSEIPFKWKFVLSLGMKLGMVKIIDVSF